MKLMEITELKKKLKTGRASITLLDTSFSQLTRRITSNTGADYTTAAEGDPLSKELIVSLNEAQIALKERYETLFSDYNTWITEKQSEMEDLETFDYEFSSVYDYSSEYEAGSTSADYYMLTSIVNAEKELYEAGNYWLMANYNSNIEVIKEWSKTQNYLSTTKSVTGFFETGYYDPYVSSVSISGVTYTASESSDKVTITVTGFENIPDGETCTIKIKATTDGYYTEHGDTYHEGGTQTAYMYIKRTVIDNDSYLTCWASKGGFDDHGYIKSYTRTGETATHFDTDTPSFTWLQNRIYL